MVRVDDNKIITDLHCKPRDTHQYLDNGSCHPKYVKAEIQYSQALRIKCIRSSDIKFRERLKELRGHLMKSGFKGNFINSQFKKVDHLSRKGLHCQKKENDKKMNRIPLVFDFHMTLLR